MSMAGLVLPILTLQSGDLGVGSGSKICHSQADGVGSRTIRSYLKKGRKGGKARASRKQIQWIESQMHYLIALNFDVIHATIMIY
jgi:hypothetical protein